jgi:ribosomal protein S2
MGWLKPRKDAAQKELERIRKKEKRETYERERHKAELRELTKKAKLDAKRKHTPLAKKFAGINSEIGQLNELLIGPQKKKRKRDSLIL